MPYDDEHAEISPELAFSIGQFLEASVQHILTHQDAERYFAELDGLIKRTGVEAWFDASMPFWAVARSIWNAVPLPSQNFRCAPLPDPRRNDPCPCGSGKKYKRCCQSLVTDHTMHLVDDMPVIHLAVTGFTLKQRQAAAKSAPAKVRLAVAEQELEQRHPGKARTLLLALLRKGSLEAELQGEAVRLIGHAYDELGHLAAGEKAMNELVPQLTPLAASVALNWLASRCLADARPADALAHVLYAESLDPDSLVNGILKTGCLRDLGADAEAQRTAQAWLPVARELGDQEAVELLEEQASMATWPPAFDEGAWHSEAEADEETVAHSDDILSIFGAPDELLRPIAGLLKAAYRQPLYPVHFDPGPPGPEGDAAQWVLGLPPEVEKAQAAFYQAGEAQSPLDPALIRRYPALLQSPDFLERLDTFTGASLSKVQEQFNEALYRQEDRLLAHILAALPAGGQLPWAWLEHRPVLRLHWQSAVSQDDPANKIEMLSRLLRLCPTDNLGVRAPLVNALLRAGEDEAALAICERFPDDALAETRYGRVLALVRLNRLHEAEQALAEAYRALPKVLNYLVANKRKQPSLNPHGITIGGADQAWYYRQEMRDVFLATPGILGWMDNTKKRLR